VTRKALGPDQGRLPDVDDLAIVIRRCGCPQSRMGQVFKVEMIVRARTVQCACCDQILAQDVDLALNLEEGIGCIRSWMRRLTPPAELGLMDELEEVAA
jgi:hypothetical protein